MKRIIVGVVPAAEHDRYRRLLDALEALYPVSFVSESEAGPGETVAARLLLSGHLEAALAAGRDGCPCFLVQAPDREHPAPAADTVQFHNHPVLDSALRGQALPDPEKCPTSLVVCNADDVVASKEGKPFWTHRAGQAGAGALDVVGIAPPVLADGEYLAQYFFREKYLRLLPLMHWLKQISARHNWQPAPRRACLVFDDPTLPSPSYGCLNFARLADHARKWNYHATVATVPLSSRRVSRENAALFRDQAAHLSLVIHGNDHVWQEMARIYPEPERLAILAQAWQRIVAMEQEYGISVGRIMEAPYGVIDQGLIEPLVRLGYEATLITPLQFLRHNRGGHFSPAMGLESIEFLNGGLCLLPRIKMTPLWKTDALLAAFLDQPIIIVGHHYDAGADMELMRQIAATVNRLEGLRWMNLADLARSQYQSRRDGAKLHVRLGSRRVILPVPDGIQEIVVTRPWIRNGGDEPLLLRDVTEKMSEQQLMGGAEVPIIPGATKRIEIISPSPQAMDPVNVPVRRPQVWPLVRRILMESRDRLYPYLHRT